MTVGLMFHHHEKSLGQKIFGSCNMEQLCLSINGLEILMITTEAHVCCSMHWFIPSFYINFKISLQNTKRFNVFLRFFFFFFQLQDPSIYSNCIEKRFFQIHKNLNKLESIIPLLFDKSFVPFILYKYIFLFYFFIVY